MDWVLIVSALLLTGIGLLSLYSSSIGKQDFSNFNKQIIFLGIALFLMFLFSFLDYRILRNDPCLILILYLICVSALAGLFLFAPEIRGIKSWYKIGPVSFDPIEATKLILIILLAKYFSMRHVEMYKVKHIFLSGVYLLIPCALIFAQPDLGSAIILIALWVGILLVSGIKISHFLILIFCGILTLTFCWLFLLKDYQKDRIISFTSPQIEPLGIGWNQAQSKIAIGSGGIWGLGFAKGSQTQYGFLPESQTDFIWASIAEEFGLFGVSIIFLLFIILLYRVLKIAFTSKTNFPRLFASGFAIILVSQIFINIGMNLGILPIIGISLPLISYGGSSLICTFIAFGVLQNIRITHIT
ncbi:MAG: rod shape-determining protein RodA [Patescibacteria group bacterium]|nr:rod shape-determining protein RodA [Patescibacteria group bacterium]